MTDNSEQNPSADTISVEMEGLGKIQLPASLAAGAGNNLVAALRFVFGGIAPDFFQRASVTQARATVVAAAADAIKNAFSDPKHIDDPGARAYAELLITTVLSESADRLERRARIVHQTVDELRSLEFQPEQNETEPISNDFLSHYWTTADRISSRGVQEIFAKILAREISRPGSFSASTLNILAILHPEMAQKFERFCCMTFSFKGLDFVIIDMPHATSLNTKPNSVSTSGRKHEQLTEFGLTREDLLELRSIGLIRSMPEDEYPNLEGFFQSTSVELARRRVLFDLQRDAPKEQLTNAIGVISLTRSGSELRSVISLAPYGPYRERLVGVMNIAAVTMKIPE